MPQPPIVVQTLPTFDQLLWPTVTALRSLGGSASVAELNEWLLAELGLPDDLANFRREGASVNEVAYRGAWARTYLRRDGVLERTAHGVWALTPRGREVTETEMRGLPQRVRRLDQAARAVKETQAEAEAGALEEEVAAEQSWKEQMLALLRDMAPSAFERLGQRLLRESGFTKVEVTGRTGDGGIDGVGVLRVQLLSFHVLFQCKRYRETVSAGSIRDFRGAMVGRTDKGLFITTGRFSTDARKEATRDGAPPMELIDGEELCELLKQLRIGVRVEMVEKIIIQPDIINNI